VWLASARDKRPLEQVLLRDASVKILISTITEADTVAASKLLAPLIPILQKCEKLNLVLGKTALVSELLNRMDTQDQAVDRTRVLQAIQLLYQYSDEPKEFITTHNMLEVLKRVVDMDEAVLVRERANELLQAMLVNTVI